MNLNLGTTGSCWNTYFPSLGVYTFLHHDLRCCLPWEADNHSWKRCKKAIQRKLPSIMYLDGKLITILKNSWSKHLSLTYNEKYEYGKKPYFSSNVLSVQTILILVMRVTWNGYLFFGTLSLAIYLIQVKSLIIIYFWSSKQINKVQNTLFMHKVHLYARITTRICLRTLTQKRQNKRRIKASRPHLHTRTEC